MRISRYCRAVTASLVAALAVLTLGLGGCAGVDDTLPPEIKLINLRPVEATGFEQRFQVDLRIINPNDFALDLDGLTFELDVNERRFASGVSDRAFTVPRLGEATTSVTASTSLIEMVQQVMGLAERTDLTYRLSGLAYLNNFAQRRVPYESSGKLELLSGQGQGLVPIAPNP